MDRETLVALLDRLPPELRAKVYDFASSLLQRTDTTAQPLRRPNLHRGAAQIHDDFDAPLPEEFGFGG